MFFFLFFGIHRIFNQSADYYLLHSICLGEEKRRCGGGNVLVLPAYPFFYFFCFFFDVICCRVELE